MAGSATVTPAPSHTVDSAAIRAKIESAQREGKHVRARVQKPALLLGALVFGIAAGVFIVTRNSSAAVLAVPCIASLGTLLLLVAVLPSTPGWVRGISIGIMIIIVLVFCLYIQLVVVRGFRAARTCRTVPGHTQCWTYELSAVRFLPCFSYMLLFLLLVGRHLRFRWSSTRALVELIWREMSRAFMIAAISLSIAFIVDWALRGEPTTNTISSAVASAFFVVIAVFAGHPAARIRLQSALASRGEAILAAAAVAAFLGSSDAESMMLRAHETFRAVPLSLLTLRHLERRASSAAADESASQVAPAHESLAEVSAPSLQQTQSPAMPNSVSSQPQLADVEAHRDVSVPVGMAQCDVFVSHAWADDPRLKFEALTAWGARFEKTFNREPMIWIDRLCLPQDKIADSVQLLPCYLAGCGSFLALAGDNYLSRLWCIAELFVFVSMGGDPSQIHVIWLVPDVPIDSFDALHAECDNEADRDRLLITVEAAAGGIHGFNTYVRNVISSSKKTTVDALSLAEASSRSGRRATLQPTSSAAGMTAANKWLPGRMAHHAKARPQAHVACLHCAG